MPRPNRPWFRASRQRWYVNMNGVQTALPVTDHKDEAGATQAMIDLILKARSGPPIRPGTIPELITEYLAVCERKGIAPKTIKSYGSYLKWFAARFGKGAIADVAPDQLSAYCRENQWSDTTRHNAVSTANSFIRWCGRKDFSAPCPPKESRGGESVISEDTYQTLLSETRGDFRELLRVLWLTGCRPSEILGLTVESINWDTKTATLKKHKTKKKGKQRVLRFGQEAFAVLARQKAKHKTGPLFRGLGNRQLSLQAVIVRLLRLRERTGVKVTAYCFRHTYATRLLSAGVPDTQVAAMLGHSSTRMIHANYSHVAENGKLLQEIADRFG